MDDMKEAVKHTSTTVHKEIKANTDSACIPLLCRRGVTGTAISLDANGELENFYADGIAYYELFCFIS